MNYIENARKFRKAMMNIAPTLDDAKASTAPDMFPRMRYDGTLIPAKTRINWNGRLVRSAVDVWDTEQNNPDNAPALWENIAYQDGFRVIPETITATLAFSMGECGWWDGVLYQSTMDGNVYTPADYPAAWALVE